MNQVPNTYVLLMQLIVFSFGSPDSVVLKLLHCYLLWRHGANSEVSSDIVSYLSYLSFEIQVFVLQTNFKMYT